MRRTFRSPLGPITLEEHDGRIKRLIFGESGQSETSPLLMEAERQIMEYLGGKRRGFEVPLSPEGTAYQKKVWNIAMEIPYGEVRTYSWVAKKAGGSPRSAGNALGANPIPVLIPCHRVVRSDGSLGGYSSGEHIKERLLRLERLHMDESVLK